MSSPVNDEALNRLFRTARTHYIWSERPIANTDLRQLYDLLKWAPTSTNANPGRFVFAKSDTAKARIANCCVPTNQAKVLGSACCAIIAWDTDFPEFLPKLVPHADAQAIYRGKPDLIEETAFRNSSLQGAYLILAARAIGLDAGPISGFDNAALDREFFPDGRWRSNFLCNLGYGDPEKLFPRNPRLDFDQACIEA
ncbi:malonic semialdehyde reductase [Altererythrobacter salegens]|uniref:Putative NADH dehydrogenase/NAD(P)H nitroreductase GRI89_14075 n=1 Tax=Croceibacterium salegens TaxID=1737568 RepID=A0A6I4SZ07_9SPHN|nr:malonic semialdehyde reductase [Croceibacterium salegens]MXO60668.1 malonic semialdehyde reductase [Croceibacterium salegens]